MHHPTALKLARSNGVRPLSPFGTTTRHFVTSDLALRPVPCLPSAMVRVPQSRLRTALLLIILIQSSSVAAAARPHIITFGRWITVQWIPDAGSADGKPLPLKVRPLLVDAHVKEFTLGPVHDLTDRLFVVRRAFRVNDSLPQESTTPPHWQWQRGGWLLVDQATGHISPLNLPEFDAFYSVASWYRDYAAYCGVSDDGKKLYAVVAQITRRKPVLKKLLTSESVVEGEKKGEVKDLAADSACPMPVWQRAPVRVTFDPAGASKQTFAIRGHIVDLVTDEVDDEEARK